MELRLAVELMSLVLSLLLFVPNAAPFSRTMGTGVLAKGFHEAHDFTLPEDFYL